MKYWMFRAAKGGEVKEGAIAASDEEMVRRQLINDGCFPLTISELNYETYKQIRLADKKIYSLKIMQNKYGTKSNYESKQKLERTMNSTLQAILIIVVGCMTLLIAQIVLRQLQ